MKFINILNVFKILPNSTNMPFSCTCDLDSGCCEEEDTCEHPDDACTHCDSATYGCDYDNCSPEDTCNTVCPIEEPELCYSSDICEYKDWSGCTISDECYIDYGKCTQHDECIFDCPCGKCDTLKQPASIVGAGD